MRSHLVTYYFSMAFLSVTALLYALLVIMPFYGYGLHQQPAVVSGTFDPKGLPLFSSGLGSLLLATAFAALLLFPMIYVALGSLSLAILLRQWQSITRRARLLGITLLCICSALMVFEFSPPGYLIWQWLLD